MQLVGIAVIQLRSTRWCAEAEQNRSSVRKLDAVGCAWNSYAWPRQQTGSRLRRKDAGPCSVNLLEPVQAVSDDV